MKKRNLAARIAPLIAAALLASGCQAGGQPAADNGLTPVSVVLDWLPNTNHTGLYVALEKGWFVENGLNVTITQPPEEGALPLVAAGKADFGISFQEDIASAITAEAPLDVVAVATIIQHNTSGIMSAKASGITRPADMEGHHYATREAPVEMAVIKELVESDGGDIAKVEMIPTQVTDAVTALSTDIDALWSYYAWDGIAAEAAGLKTNFFYLKDFAPVLDFYTPVIVSSEAYLKENPETAGAFMAAVSKGYEFAAENPAEAAEILVKHAPETDSEIALKSQEYLKREYVADANRWGEIDQARWDAFYAWLYEKRLIPREIKPGQGFTNDYLPTDR